MMHASAFRDEGESRDSFAFGDPLTFLLRELESYPVSRSTNAVRKFEKNFDISLSSDTRVVLYAIHGSEEPRKLLQTIEDSNLDGYSDYEISDLDKELEFAHVSREIDAGDAKYKKHRRTVYVPELHMGCGEGDVYMAKSISSLKKVKMAWDLHEDNEIVVVEEYETFEDLLGWSKLKDLPHRTASIVEEYGDRLSDEVLDSVTSERSSNKGKKRTSPKEKVLTVSTSTRSYGRLDITAESIKDYLDRGRELPSSRIRKLVLFPSSTEYNLSENRWITNSMSVSGKVAVANCNKSTFEYLDECDNVYHVEDYFEQSTEYLFETSEGIRNISCVDTGSVVFHLMSEEMKEMLDSEGVFESIQENLQLFADESTSWTVDLPDPDDMLYVPIVPEDVFCLTPVLRQGLSVVDEKPYVVLGDVSHPNISVDVSGDSYKLYARVRLPEWDFDSVEMSLLDGFSQNIDLCEGGLELVETLAELHDRGVRPYSQQ